MENREVFQLIDLDRTLFDTSLFVKLICDAVDQYQPGLGNEIDKEFEAAYKREESFFALEYIRRTLGRESYKRFVSDAMRKIDGESLLLPGTRERLELAETLSGESPQYGIFTYSLYPEDQELKVKLAGIDHIAMHIETTPNKAEVIASWQRDDGTFQLPDTFGGKIVDELILEDDKLRAFYNLPENVTGVWVTSRPDAEAQIAKLGYTNLRSVSHLGDSAEYIRRTFLA